MILTTKPLSRDGVGGKVVLIKIETDVLRLIEWTKTKS